MPKLVEGSQDWNIAAIIVEQNEDLADEATCYAVGCFNVSCEDCPMGEGLTLGDVRGSIRPVDAEPEVPDDGVRKPSHYQVFDGVESIEIIARSMTVSEFRGFCFGNVLKYRLRAGKKSELATMEKDLNKAAFYQELFDMHNGKCYAAE